MTDSMQWAAVLDRVRTSTTTERDARYLEEVLAAYRATQDKLGKCYQLWRDMSGGTMKTCVEGRCVWCKKPVTLVCETIHDEQHGRGRVVYGEVCDRCLAKFEREMHPELSMRVDEVTP